MKRIIVATILGLPVAFSTFSASADGLVMFSTYLTVNNYGAFGWTTDPTQAPPGLAGQQLAAESQYFNASLWFGVGANPGTWYQALNSATQLPATDTLGDFSAYGLGGGWLGAEDYPVVATVVGNGLPAYSSGPYTFRIVLTGTGPYEGAGGTLQFTEPSLAPYYGYPYCFFSQLPPGPPHTPVGGGVIQVIALPEPSATILLILGSTALVLRRRCVKKAVAPDTGS
jgi:hypothetical protein